MDWTKESLVGLSRNDATGLLLDSGYSYDEYEPDDGSGYFIFYRKGGSLVKMKVPDDRPTSKVSSVFLAA